MFASTQSSPGEGLPGEAYHHAEADLLSNVRQLIWVGRRSGEGYFSPDGRWMVFQAEREPDNPFYQIYLLDRATGQVQRVSPGYGKTTCAWIHPSGQRVLFSSTHHDPEARAKMQAELERRAQGGAGGPYAWDYDPEYDLYEWVVGTGEYRRLTEWPGYTAEASWSPDGSMIVCASNRRAFEGPLTAREAEKFAADPSVLIDIYLLAADGSWVRRLTDGLGYDGGPFFSPDGQRIVWRRFDAEGRIAEIWTMRLDGSDQRQLTRLGVMSWAPFYHPSGDYIIFTTNRHGFGNFELYMVDAQGEREPVRVTFTDGPDVLPVFTPDGRELVWVSRRTDGRAQLHIAHWNDARARELLGLPARQEAAQNSLAGGADARLGAAAWASSSGRRAGDGEAAEIGEARRIVERLASPEMDGRLTGTEGERRAAEFVAAEFARLGLEPAGEDGYLQSYEFTSGVHLDGLNLLVAERDGGLRRELVLDVEWRPLAFSRTGGQDLAPVSFVGYGLVAPGERDQEPYDSYGELDVTGHWVLVLRYVPEDVDPARRQYLSRYASLRYKAMEARDRGAVGILIASGPRSQVREQLVPLTFDGSVAGAPIPAVSIADTLAMEWLASAGHDLEALQAALDGGQPLPGFGIDGLRVGAHIGLGFSTGQGRNVLARIRGKRGTELPMVVVGAHLDHLGHGERGNSLARGEEQGQLHPGADDNASGVAGLLLIARRLAARQVRNGNGLDRDVLLAAWTGEELGLLGSSHFAKQYEATKGPLAESVAAYINLDMIGRLEKQLVLQAVASSPDWQEIIERAAVVAGVPLALSDDTYLPTDATAFYTRGVPILAAFTGTYSEHHSPRDRPEILNYEGLVQVARLIEALVADLAAQTRGPTYARVEAPRGATKRSSRVYLGTIPDFSQTSGYGVLLGGVMNGGPAERAGILAGDRIVELAGQPIENIYEYMRVMDALKIGQPVPIVVERGEQRVTLEIVPGSRD